MDSKIVDFVEPYENEIVQIRTTVFVKEQNISADLDFDGQDGSAIHVLVFNGVKPIATARMLEDGHIGRLAVLKTQRRKGAGSLVLKALINEAKRREIKSVYLASQLHAADFYQTQGFKTCGDVFMEVGIQHIIMELYLDA
jgi:hypothetical protein